MGIRVSVDCFVVSENGHGVPAALRYLESMGVDPAEAVELIVATHWHDDHIRGMSALVDACARATFCCSGALRQREFLAMVGAVAGREVSVCGSGASEIHAIFSSAGGSGKRRAYALANKMG